MQRAAADMLDPAEMLGVRLHEVVPVTVSHGNVEGDAAERAMDSEVNRYVSKVIDKRFIDRFREGNVAVQAKRCLAIMNQWKTEDIIPDLLVREMIVAIVNLLEKRQPGFKLRLMPWTEVFLDETLRGRSHFDSLQRFLDEVRDHELEDCGSIRVGAQQSPDVTSPQSWADIEALLLGHRTGVPLDVLVLLHVQPLTGRARAAATSMFAPGSRMEDFMLLPLDCVHASVIVTPNTHDLVDLVRSREVFLRIRGADGVSRLTGSGRPMRPARMHNGVWSRRPPPLEVVETDTTVEYSSPGCIRPPGELASGVLVDHSRTSSCPRTRAERTALRVVLRAGHGGAETWVFVDYFSDYVRADQPGPYPDFKDKRVLWLHSSVHAAASTTPWHNCQLLHACHIRGGTDGQDQRPRVQRRDSPALKVTWTHMSGWYRGGHQGLGAKKNGERRWTRAENGGGPERRIEFSTNEMEQDIGFPSVLQPSAFDRFATSWENQWFQGAGRPRYDPVQYMDPRSYSLDAARVRPPGSPAIADTYPQAAVITSVRPRNGYPPTGLYGSDPPYTSDVMFQALEPSRVKITFGTAPCPDMRDRRARADLTRWLAHDVNGVAAPDILVLTGDNVCTAPKGQAAWLPVAHGAQVVQRARIAVIISPRIQQMGAYVRRSPLTRHSPLTHLFKSQGPGTSTLVISLCWPMHSEVVQASMPAAIVQAIGATDMCNMHRPTRDFHVVCVAAGPGVNLLKQHMSPEVSMVMVGHCGDVPRSGHELMGSPRGTCLRPETMRHRTDLWQSNRLVAGRFMQVMDGSERSVHGFMSFKEPLLLATVARRLLDLSPATQRAHADAARREHRAAACLHRERSTMIPGLANSTEYRRWTQAAPATGDLGVLCTLYEPPPPYALACAPTRNVVQVAAQSPSGTRQGRDARSFAWERHVTGADRPAPGTHDTRARPWANVDGVPRFNVDGVPCITTLPRHSGLLCSRRWALLKGAHVRLALARVQESLDLDDGVVCAVAERIRGDMIRRMHHARLRDALALEGHMVLPALPVTPVWGLEVYAPLDPSDCLGDGASKFADPRETLLGLRARALALRASRSRWRQRPGSAGTAAATVPAPGVASAESCDRRTSDVQWQRRKDGKRRRQATEGHKGWGSPAPKGAWGSATAAPESSAGMSREEEAGVTADGSM